MHKSAKSVFSCRWGDFPFYSPHLRKDIVSNDPHKIMLAFVDKITPVNLNETHIMLVPFINSWVLISIADLLLSLTNLFFSFSVTDLYFALDDFFLTLVDLSLIELLSIGQAPFERSSHCHLLLHSTTSISSSIWRHHFSSFTSNATLISFLAHKCSYLETSCSSPSAAYAKPIFFSLNFLVTLHCL